MTQEQEIEVRLAQYRKILARSTQHTYALQATLKDAGVFDIQRWFLHVFAPVTIEFVLWTLHRAVKNGHKRLYFLARDSYLFYGIAKRVVESAQLDIDCRYLNLSRYSLRSAEYALMEQEERLSFICARGLDVTFEKIMHRGGLTDAEAREIAEQCGYHKNYDQVLAYAQIEDVKAKLGDNKQFQTYVEAHSVSAYPNVLGYLQQEGLSDGVPFAVVDSGWLGTIQKSLQRLLRTKEPDVRVCGYYFGLYETPVSEAASDYEAYYFGQRGGLRRKAHFSNCLFELVFSSPEGMTLGYEKIGGYYYPIKSKAVNPNGDVLIEHARLLERYLDAYIEACKCKNNSENWWAQIDTAHIENQQKTIEALLTLLMSAPIKKEAELYGRGLFCDDILESQMQPIAADLTYKEISDLRFLPKLLIMAGIRKGAIHDSAWIEGSIVNCGTHVKRSLKAAIRYKYFSYFRKAIKK